MALLSRVGLFRFCFSEIPMPVLDIVTMRGAMPRVEPHLLSDEVAVIACDCHFDHGVISPLEDDASAGVELPIVPTTLFHYGQHWFAWNKVVEVMRSPIAQDPYGRVYYTDGEYPKVTHAQIATGGSNKPTAWYRLGIPAPGVPVGVGTITPPVGGVDDDLTDDETRFYVDTFVTAMGEEGPPGPVSGKVNIGIPGSSVTLMLSQPTTQNSNITKRRIYRSVSGGGLADYLLVAELPIAQASFVDIREDGELGAVLETYDYTMPPDGMRGLCQMANGMCAGFAGNSLYLCEPYLPYAWPEKYRLTTEHDIVAIAAIDTTLVIGTKGYPYLAQGVSPASVTTQKLSQLPQSCVSGRSMVAMDGVVLYASPDGLVGIGANGGQVVTEQVITRKQWRAMKPETMRAWHHEGKYVAMTDTHAFIFDPKSGDLRELTNRWEAAVSDMESDSLYIAKGRSLQIWRGGSSSNGQFVWRSKPFMEPEGSSFSCCRVLAQDVGLVGIKLFVDGEQVMELSPGNLVPGAFRLPPVRGRFWQIEVFGTSVVSRITLASSMAEMVN
ncbi:hypothetical protein [Aeromonas caviae]|uniref:hypothetical protein n=1 Tax=Aeromonas caviae TaxID=648 RepID=UPI000DCFAF12|nr:hypothetical protein [Aeromonas caviae]